MGRLQVGEVEIAGDETLFELRDANSAECRLALAKVGRASALDRDSGTISQVASRSGAAQRLRDLSRLRRGYPMTRRIERATAGIPSCVAKQVTGPIRNREAPVPSRS